MDIQQTLQSAQDSLTAGDGAASRMLITVGSFVVISDITYRLATSKVKIQTPSWEDALKGLAAGTTPGIVAGVVTGRLFEWWNDAIPKIDIEMGKGLWDWKFTCMGFGCLVAGIGLLVAEHPEWISEMIDRAQKVREMVESAAIKMLQNAMTTEEGASQIDLASLASLAGLVLPMVAA